MSADLERDGRAGGWHLRVRGQVQGVGFRPFVARLAEELGLTGWVRNDAAGVELWLSGRAAGLADFLARLQREAPPLARIDSVAAEPSPAGPTAEEEAAHRQSGQGEVTRAVGARFRILRSGGGEVRTGVTPDAGTCVACLEELFDPADRRYRYPFINCTHCGPRFSITRGLPYDRPQTSMGCFSLCPACAAEYDDPYDRRFHAQPNACPDCGPSLTLRSSSGATLAAGDPVATTLEALGEGKIVALKGVGGFHLVCDATRPEVVARLRERKDREEKPLAVMVAGVAAARRLGRCEGEGAALLGSAPRPIVLLRKRAACDGLLPGVAPGLGWIGVMLPYAPLHYLLFHEAAGRPAGVDWLASAPSAADPPMTLVMTSANPGGEPLVIGNREALRRLEGIADFVVTHDRDVVVRCDDSVVRPRFGGTTFVRRARGYTPQRIRLSRRGPPVLAVGGWYKSAICLTRGDEAFLSQHIGDLDNAATLRALDEAVTHLQRVLEVAPVRIAHDLHPDYFSVRLARELAGERGIPCVAVQHHHAHAAAVAAEHHIEGPFLALALDGVGLGSDGGAWGGELLRVEGAHFERLGHLWPLALPGGDRASREPWRMAASVLDAIGRREEITLRFGDEPAAAGVAMMLGASVQVPPTSSLGRLFDAAAGLLGVRRRCSFEAQAAMALEGLAEAYGPAPALKAGYILSADGVLDLRPLMAALADERDPRRGAAIFHATLAGALVDWAAWAARKEALGRVVLGGGCLLNAILAGSLREGLARAGLRGYEAQGAPPGDGGLALGQAWVALQS